MTRLCLLALLCLLNVLSATAQTERGNLLLGGNGSVRFTDPFMVSLNPNVGYFLADQLAMGSALFVNALSSGSFNNTSLGITPFVRYYFGQTNLRPFVLAQAGYSRIWPGYRNFGSPISEGMGDLSLGVGLTYFISRQVGLEATFSRRTLIRETFTDNTLGLNFGFQIYIDRQDSR